MLKSVPLALTLLSAGCGGKSLAANPDSAGGAAGSTPEAAGGVTAGGATMTTPGVGPIDATGLPTELPEQCPIAVDALKLRLPCKVGQSLGRWNAVECYDLDGGTALSFGVPLDDLASELNQELTFPISGNPPANGTMIAGTVYTSELNGTIVFSQVDPAGRAFVARLSAARVDWSDGAQRQFSCDVSSTPLWAVAGDFL